MDNKQLAIPVRSLCYLASVCLIFFSIDQLIQTDFVSSNHFLASVPAVYPQTSLVEVRSPSEFSLDAIQENSAPESYATSKGSAALQISGQAVLAASQSLSPTFETPVGVHVVESPQGKVCRTFQYDTLFYLDTVLLYSVVTCFLFFALAGHLLPLCRRSSRC